MGMPMIGISGSLDSEETQVTLMRTYLRAVGEAGGIPVLLSPDMDDAALAACLDRLDGILLAGGGDMAPALFGEEPIPELGDQSPLRDAFELRLLQHALSKKMPTLGICRGVQVMNVAMGGTLYQDLPAQYQPAQMPLLAHKQTAPYATPTHTVTVQTGTLLNKLTGQTVLDVNSMHHQAAWKIAPQLRVSATAPDGVTEALEAPEHPFYLGVQWHPERLADAGSKQLFKGFVEAAATYGSRRDG